MLIPWTQKHTQKQQLILAAKGEALTILQELGIVKKNLVGGAKQRGFCSGYSVEILYKRNDYLSN